MRVSIVIATFGADDWRDTAWSHAYPSAVGQGALEVLVHHEPEGTLASSRNAAAAHAQGEALIYLDADDQLGPGYLKAMEGWLTSRIVLSSDAEEIQTSSYSPPHLLVPAVEYVRADGWRQEPRIPQKGTWPKLNECVIGTLVSRALFEQVGGFREWPSLEDYDLWLRCYDAGARLAYVPDAVYRAYVSERSRNADQSPYAAIWAEHLARIGAA